MPLGWKSFRSRNASVPNLREPPVDNEAHHMPSVSAFEAKSPPADRTPQYVTAADYYALSRPSAPASRHSHQPRTPNDHTNISKHSSKTRPRPQHQGSHSYDVFTELYTTPLYRQSRSSPTNNTRQSKPRIMNDGRSSFDADQSTGDARRYHVPPSIPSSTPSHSPKPTHPRVLPAEPIPNHDERNYTAAGTTTPTGRPRVSSSGSSAYTGYVDTPSSPSSQGHFQIPPLPNKTSASVIGATANNYPLTKSQSNEPPIPAPLAPNQSPRMRTISSPLAEDRAQNRSPRTKPQPTLPPNIIAPKYAPTFNPPYSSPPGGISFPTIYPTPTTSSNPNFVPASPVAMSAQPYSASSPDYRTGGTVQYAPEPTRPTPRSHEAPATSIVPPLRRQTRKPTVAQTHACMSLHRMDKLRLIKFPMSTVAAVKSAIERSWTRGLQSEKETGVCIDFQLRGNPWSGQGDEAIPAIYMMCEIMSTLYHVGWNLTMSTDISKRAMDKDTLVYRQSEIPSPCAFMAVSFSDGDRLRLIKPPNDVINAVKATWGGSIQKESWRLDNICWEFKLAGNPWWSNGDDSVLIRIHLLNMLDALNALGWDLHASVDMTAGPGGLGKNAGADTDCWILRKPSS